MLRNVQQNNTKLHSTWVCVSMLDAVKYGHAS